jgi:hypothetical protein
MAASAAGTIGELSMITRSNWVVMCCKNALNRSLERLRGFGGSVGGILRFSTSVASAT